MNFLPGVFGGSNAQSAKPGEGASLLSDWNSYSQGGDVEAPGGGGSGGAGTSASTAMLFQNVDSARTYTTDFFSSSFSAVRASAAANMPNSETFRYSIPTTQQLAYFFSFLAAGGVFLTLSFTIFLPTIILAPSKFAMSFTLGSMCVMGAFSALRGWKQQYQHMTSQERLPFSASYLLSILATLYSALIMHSYLLCLLSSGAQVVALLYYVLSYFPGGAQGVRFMLNMFYSAVFSCCGSLMRGK